MRRVCAFILILCHSLWAERVSADERNRVLCKIFSRAISLRLPKSRPEKLDGFQEALEMREGDSFLDLLAEQSGRKMHKEPGRYDYLVDAGAAKVAALGVSISKGSGEEGTYFHFDPSGTHPVNQLARELKELFGTELRYDPNGLDLGHSANFSSSNNVVRVSDAFVQDLSLDLDTVHEIVHAAIYDRLQKGEIGPFHFLQYGFVYNPDFYPRMWGDEMAAKAVEARLVVKALSAQSSIQRSIAVKEMKQIAELGLSHAEQALESNLWVQDWLMYRSANAFSVRIDESPKDGVKTPRYYLRLRAAKDGLERHYTLQIPVEKFSEWGIAIPNAKDKVRSFPKVAQEKIEDYIKERVTSSRNMSEHFVSLYTDLNIAMSKQPPDVQAAHRISRGLFRAAGFSHTSNGSRRSGAK